MEHCHLELSVCVFQFTWNILALILNSYVFDVLIAENSQQS